MEVQADPIDFLAQYVFFSSSRSTLDPWPVYNTVIRDGEDVFAQQYLLTFLLWESCKAWACILLLTKGTNSKLEDSGYVRV